MREGGERGVASLKSVRPYPLPCPSFRAYNSNLYRQETSLALAERLAPPFSHLHAPVSARKHVKATCISTTACGSNFRTNRHRRIRGPVAHSPCSICSRRMTV
jgi:hypothetical protein